MCYKNQQKRNKGIIKSLPVTIKMLTQHKFSYRQCSKKVFATFCKHFPDTVGNIKHNIR